MSLVYEFKFREHPESFFDDNWVLEVRVVTRAKSKRRLFIEQRHVNKKLKKITPWETDYRYKKGVHLHEVMNAVLVASRGWEPIFVEVPM